MKRISIRLLLALLTFFAGISVTAIWMLYQKPVNVPIPKSEELWAAESVYDSQIPKARKQFWEKEILKRFKEVPLEKTVDSANETYRMVLLPTFDAPIMVKIWRDGDSYFLMTKKTDGMGGFGLDKFGKLSFEKTRTLTVNEWNDFIKLIDESMFWQMPPYIEEMIVADGALWVIEGQMKNRHQEVRRILPTEEFQASCTYLLRLSGFASDYDGYWTGVSF